MMNEANLRTVLITGASAGFGKASAELLAKEGYRLVLIARREDKLKELAETLDTEVYTAKVDVTKRDEVSAFFANLPAEFSEIDVLVNNAGGALGADPADQCDLDDWETMVDANVKGVLYFTHNVLKQMKVRDKGYIINIGSIAAHAPYPGGNVYGASKAFVRQFTRNLRADLLGTSIRATNIEPGAAETEFSEVRFKGDKEKAKAVYAGSRSLQAIDIAETVSWLLSRPLQVNIDNIEVAALDQSWAGLKMHRSE